LEQEEKQRKVMFSDADDIRQQSSIVNEACQYDTERDARIRRNDVITAREKELVITRVVEAPRKFVWKAWTDADYVMRWWGPKFFTAPCITIDFRVGGKYIYSMRGAGPDGAIKDFWNTGEYLAIVPMEKIVSTMSFADEHGNPVPASHYDVPGEWPDEIIMTATFEDIGAGKTKVTIREVGIPGAMIEFAGLGWDQQFDKLTELLK
jgi:uncharacterized protein YndB with AHSA1/START domain